MKTGLECVHRAASKEVDGRLQRGKASPAAVRGPHSHPYKHSDASHNARLIDKGVHRRKEKLNFRGGGWEKEKKRFRLRTPLKAAPHLWGGRCRSKTPPRSCKGDAAIVLREREVSVRRPRHMTGDSKSPRPETGTGNFKVLYTIGGQASNIRVESDG